MDFVGTLRTINKAHKINENAWYLFGKSMLLKYSFLQTEIEKN